MLLKLAEFFINLCDQENLITKFQIDKNINLPLFTNLQYLNFMKISSQLSSDVWLFICDDQKISIKYPIIIENPYILKLYLNYQ